MASWRVSFSTFLICFFAASLSVLSANAATVKSLRVSHTNAATRLVLVLDAPVQQTWFINGDRLILDLQNSKSIADFSDLELDKTAIKSVRSFSLKKNKLRFEIQLQKKIQPKIFALKKREGKED